VKPAPAQIVGLLKQPPDTITAILLFGPDDGLVRERADAVTRAVLGGVGDDPFRLAVLTGEAVKQDPALLADEADQLSLIGGRRVIRLRDAGDPAAKALEPVLSRKPGGGLVVIEAGDLPRSSALRKLAEAAVNAVAIACYADDPRAIAQLIRDLAARDRITLAEEAVAYLTTHLGDDRGVTRSELEKLCLYAGPGGRIDLEAAIASIGDSSALALDDVVYDALDGEALAVEQALTRLFLEGQSAVAVLRAVQRHAQRLHLAAARLAEGESTDQIARSQRPPLYFKLVDRFTRQLAAWPAARLQRLMALLLKAELDCKTTGFPEEVICRHCLSVIGRLPGRPQR
jgi:DNA polymerase III subunit delta